MLFFGLAFSVTYFFFFKQKTAYEMRISDWSSDVCSSDLILFANLDQQGGIVLEIDFAAHHCADVTIEDIQFTIGFHAYDTVAFANLMAVPNDDTVVVVCADRNWRVRIYGGLKASVQCVRSEEHTSELQSLMRLSYAVFCLK